MALRQFAIPRILVNLKLKALYAFNFFVLEWNMFYKVISGSLFGIESEIVTVEVDLAQGLPCFQVVGLPDTSVRESKERIRSALVNSGLKFPAKRITVNLSPANTKKEGTHFDLPIAIGIAASLGYINLKNSHIIENYAFLGELSLDGKVNKVKGALPIAIGLRSNGIKNLIAPVDNIEELEIVEDINLIPVKSLNHVLDFLNKKAEINHECKSQNKIYSRSSNEDFSDVYGQESVKRAIQIAAAASHNILMIGPPGSGKSMIAKRIPSILPSLSFDEILEVTKIYSIAGELSKDMPIVNERQFRSPHHTITKVGLFGGGINPKPGEVTLAHNGVLYFDELPEFSRMTLELLRQPMEDEKILISRANRTVTFPSKFMFVASMNPCPCGYYGSNKIKCICKEFQIKNYLSKCSGPLLDRIDMHIDVLPIEFKDMNNCSSNKTSLEMKMEVENAMEIQIERYKRETISYNSQLTQRLMNKYCTLDSKTKNLMESAFTKLNLSARGYNKIIKISRTIADLDRKEKIDIGHVAEAISYRSIDKKYFG
jgi:magnesium chelatase family protein